MRGLGVTGEDAHVGEGREAILSKYPSPILEVQAASLMPYKENMQILLS